MAGGCKTRWRTNEHAPVEQRRRRGGTVLESVSARVHGEHHVQIVDHLTGEPLVELLLRVEHQPVALCALLALRHQRRQLVTLEQTRHLAIRQQRVESLQERRVQHVRLVHDEADLLAL